jgi:MFS transporter, DHA1 family, putative efflux transporter
MDGARKRQLTALSVGWLTMFVIGTDLFVISPLLPLIAGGFRISAPLAGLAVTVFSLTYMVSAPVFGNHADRVGRRPVLISGLLIFAAANLATAVAGGLVPLLVARIVAGAAAAAVSPSIYALVAAAAPPERRASWMALVVSGLLVSLALGAPIGGWMGVTMGWGAVFIFLALWSLLLVIPNSCVWPQDRSVGDNATASRDRLGVKIVAVRLMPMVLWSTGLYGMYTYLGVALANAGYSIEQTARAVLVYGAGAIVGVLIGGRLADRFGAKFMAAVGLLGLAVCFLGLQLAIHAGAWIELALGLTSAIAQLFFPAQQAGLANDFPARRASMMAWNNSGLFLGISLGSLFGGQAVAFAGFEADLMLAVGFALAGAVVVGLVVPPGLDIRAAGRTVT